MTTTKPKKINPPPLDVAAQRRAEYEAVLAEALALDAYAETAPTKAAIITSWMRGDQRFSALDYLVAGIERQERLPKLQTALRQKLRTARDRLIPEDLSLAEAAASILGKRYDLPAQAGALAPEHYAHDGGDGLLYVIQHGAHAVADAEVGALRGRLSVVLVRGQRHKLLGGEDVLDALEAEHWRFRDHVSEAVSTMPCDGGEVDEHGPFDVACAFSEVPVLAAPSGERLADTLAGLIASNINDRIRLGVRGMPAEGKLNATITGSRSDGDGNTLTAGVAEVHLLGRDLRSDVLIEEVKISGQRVIGHYTKAGRLAKIGVQHAGPVNNQAGYLAGIGATITFEAVSKRPPSS